MNEKNSHYFTENPEVAHHLREIEYEGLALRTDAGVFSGSRVDFGSDLLIRSLPALSGRVLDVGCGYGPMGLSVAKANPAAQVVMIDINSRAIELSQYNAKRNRLENVDVFQSDGFEKVEGEFQTVVMNPPIRTGKKNVYALFDGAFEHLMPGGVMYIVIQKKQGADSAVRYLGEKFASVDTIERKAGYHIIACKKG